MSPSSSATGPGAAEENKEEETRDWAELALDAISSILHKLDHVHILMGPDQVCRSWRSAARDEPELWRRIRMLGHAQLFNLHGMAREAVRRSAGASAPATTTSSSTSATRHHLKSLHLISCDGVSNEGLTEAIQKFPLLEDLEISLCQYVGESGVFRVAGRACPQLKRFRLNRDGFYYPDNRDYDKDEEALGIATMHGLRSLQLSGNRVSNKGLEAILDNCRHLESLDLRYCFNLYMNDTLRAKCSRISSLRLPH